MKLYLFHHLVTKQLVTAAQNNVFEHVESKHLPNDCHAYSELRHISFNVVTVNSSNTHTTHTHDAHVQ